MRKLISIVVPFYNEANCVDNFYHALTAIFSKVPHLDFEVICTDDGSIDDTLKNLLALSDPRFRIIELSRNFGKEAALTAGIDFAKGNAVIPIDADLQDPPELILKLIETWEQGAEVVLAKRIDRSHDSFLKRKTAQIFYWLHNRLSTLKIPDNVGDFRLMDRIVVDALKRLPERQRFMKGLFAWAGFKTVVVNYVRQARHVGKTKFSIWRLWGLALEAVTSFSTVPLRIWTYVGAIGACFTLIYAAFILMRTLIYGVDVPGYASLLIAVLFFGSLQLVSLGILGEYLGRIYMETKQRPLYLIRKHHNRSV